MVIYWPGHRPRHHCLIVTGGIHRKQELRFVNERQKQRIWLFCVSTATFYSVASVCHYNFVLLVVLCDSYSESFLYVA